jgi:HEAT repeat protein
MNYRQIFAGFSLVLICLLAAGCADSVEQNIRRLTSPDANERVKAVENLQIAGDARAIAPLIACLGDQNAAVRMAVSLSLRGLGWKPSDPALQADFLIAAQDWKQLAKLGSAAAKPLWTRLRDENPAIAVQAAKVLLAIHSPVVAQIPAGSPEAVPVIACLQDREQSVREAAMAALKHIPDERAIKPVINCMMDSDWAIRMDSIEVLGRIGAPAVAPLVELLQADPEAPVASCAVAALGRIGAPALPVMIGYVKLEQGPLFGVACSAITQMGPTAVDSLIACLQCKTSFARKVIVTALGNIMDKRSVEPLIGCLNDDDPEVREKVVKSLMWLGDLRAVEPLIDCLQDENASVRLAAAEALGQFADARAVEPLVNCLNNGSEMLRQTATTALGYIPDQRSVEPLLARFQAWNCEEESVDTLCTYTSSLTRLGWKPKDDRQRTYFLISLKDGGDLGNSDHWEVTKKVLWADLQSHDRMANGICTFIRIGNETILPELTKYLLDKGDAKMAEICFFSKRSELTEAAQRWVYQHKASLHRLPPSLQGVKWGLW